eukprot:scaffold319_cov244-Pinguiococcus_pyrenoidosus.AAC.19
MAQQHVLLPLGGPILRRLLLKLYSVLELVEPEDRSGHARVRLGIRFLGRLPGLLIDPRRPLVQVPLFGLHLVVEELPEAAFLVASQLTIRCRDRRGIRFLQRRQRQLQLAPAEVLLRCAAEAGTRPEAAPEAPKRGGARPEGRCPRRGRPKRRAEPWLGLEPKAPNVDPEDAKPGVDTDDPSVGALAGEVFKAPPAPAFVPNAPPAFPKAEPVLPEAPEPKLNRVFPGDFLSVAAALRLVPTEADLANDPPPAAPPN